MKLIQVLADKGYVDTLEGIGEQGYLKVRPHFSASTPLRVR